MRHRGGAFLSLAEKFLDLADLGNEAAYTPRKAYGDSKLANILHARELHARFAGLELAAAAFHPGGVATNFAVDSTSRMRWVYHTPLRRVLLSAEKGADTLIWLAEGRAGRDWRSGEYYEKRKVAPTNPQADDDALARALWERSAEMVGVPA